MLMTIESELRVPVATVQLVKFHFVEPIAGALREEEAYRLDLCLTPRPRNARACYSDRWAPHRFERIGNVFLLPPREAMQTRSDCGRQASIVCQLRPDPIRAWFGGDLEWTDRRLTAPRRPGSRKRWSRRSGSGGSEGGGGGPRLTCA